MTRFAYDVLDWLVSNTNPLGGTTRFSYDPDGNLVNTTDRKNQTATFTYDALATHEAPRSQRIPRRTLGMLSRVQKSVAPNVCKGGGR